MCHGFVHMVFSSAEQQRLRCFLQREGFVNDSLQLSLRQEARHLLHLAPIWPHKPQVMLGPHPYCPQRQPVPTLSHPQGALWCSSVTHTRYVALQLSCCRTGKVLL